MLWQFTVDKRVDSQSRAAQSPVSRHPENVNECNRDVSTIDQGSTISLEHRARRGIVSYPSQDQPGRPKHILGRTALVSYSAAATLGASYRYH